MKLGKPIKYLAVPPGEVLERVKKKVHADAQTEINILNSIKDSEILTELTQLHNQGLELVEPSDYSGIIKGRSNIYSHMESMIKGAKKTVSINTTEEGLIRKNDSLYKAIEKASKRGVKVQLKAPLTKINEEHNKKLSQISKITQTSNNSRFCLVDGQEMLFMLMGDDSIHPSFEVGVWVKAPLFVNDIETHVFTQ